MEKKYSGVYTVMVTPFNKDGSFNLEAAKANIDYLAKSGIKGFLMLGGTGEYQSVSNEEHKFYTSQMIPYAKKRGLTVVVGVSRERPDEVIELMKHDQKYGADLAMLCAPFYSNPTQNEIVENFKYIAKNTDMDILAYNNPFATAVDIGRDAMREILNIPNVRAVKDSSGAINHLIEDMYDAPEGKSVICGSEDLACEAYLLGADGCLSGLSNYCPKSAIEIYEAVKDGEIEKAKELYAKVRPLLNTMEYHSNYISALKYILKKYRGLDMGYMRRPRLEISDAERQEIDELFAKYGYADIE